jgi:pimeloyl-ACP methyl ester carboxylesterase
MERYVMNVAQPMTVRTGIKYRFDHKDMDYYFAWILGRQYFSGSDSRECFDAADRIVEGDPASWQAVWASKARQVEAFADHAALEGKRAVARDAYLRACTYHRATLFMMDPASPQFCEQWEGMRTCLVQAGNHSEYPFEFFGIPYKDNRLPAYFFRSSSEPGRQPMLIVIGGVETFAEDLYFIAAPAALQRGYSVLAVDLPGQGMTPIRQGLFLEARSDRAVRAVLDYALAHLKVDPDRLALFGFSWGGHIALKAAVNEPRIKALIANPATHNIFSSALSQQSAAARTDPVVRLVFRQLAWRFGVSLGNIPARLVRAAEFMLYANADVTQISCPSLCMAGESEAGTTLKQTRETHERLPNPFKRLAILSQEEGGAAHCQVDNLELLNRVIFDWLEQVWLAKPA